MAVNLDGGFFGCKRAVQQMLTQEVRGEARGRIINLASQHGMVACPGDPAYAVSKAGVAHLTRQIAVDYAKNLIVCNAIAPGKILTGRTDIAVNPDQLLYSGLRTPWPRLGQPGDVAGAAAFLASDMASYVTGVNLLVDGGWVPDRRIDTHDTFSRQPTCRVFLRPQGAMPGSRAAAKRLDQVLSGV